MRVSPYARTEVWLITLIGLAVAIGTGWVAGWWAIAPAVLAAALLAFYRDPPRSPPPRDDALIAPADGRVIDISTTDGDDAAQPRPLRILIFLSVFNVHINRSPCAGRVLEVHYRPGQFINALRREAADRNESNALVIEPVAPITGPVIVRQIAGVLARRIVCAARPGDVLSAGQRFGMIKLGSQTELRAAGAERWNVRVRVGDQVAAGRTILAELKEEPRTP
jgi:phosphatidylserine decarboxylase